MGSISSLTAENRLPGRPVRDSVQVSVHNRIPVKTNVYKVIGHMVYDEILETVKSFLIILAILALCELTGFCSWWVQLVGKAV